MAFKRSAVRSRLSPPRTGTHVEPIRYMGPCSFITPQKGRMFDSDLQGMQKDESRFVGP